MNSSQINFFMMPEDVAELEQYIKEQGLVMVADRMPEKKPVILQKLATDNFLTTYIANPSNLNKLKIEYSENQKVYYIMPIQSPVIEFQKPVYIPAENRMNKGRLYFAKTKLSEDERIVDTDEITVKAAENIFKWFKKHYKNAKVNSWFTTERTHLWATKNNVVLSD